MFNNAKEIYDALELCVHELEGAISGENAQDAGYLSGCILVQLGRIRECIAALSSNKNGKIITDIRLFAIGDQWGAEVEYPDGSTEPIWAVNGNQGSPDWENDEKEYEEWYNRALDEAHKQGFKLEGELYQEISKVNGIERIVRDAIISYQEMYANAPNDDVECELIERAKLGNAWLVANGYQPEPTCFEKGELSCL